MIKVTMPKLDTIISQMETYQKGLVRNRAEVEDKLIELGNEKLDERLTNASYTGEKRAWVAPVEFNQGDGEFAIGIAGESVTFIEFGTGTMYPDNHPMMDEFGFERGKFGKGQGANPPWFFEEDGRIVKSFGNEANRVVYNTGKDLREALPDILKEVYGK